MDRDLERSVTSGPEPEHPASSNAADLKKSDEARQGLARMLLDNRLLLSGGLILLFLLLCVAVSPLLTRAGILPDPIRQEASGLDEDGMPLPPGRDHLLGTDGVGRDILSRVLHGTRVSLIVGFASMLTATIAGVTVGLLAGYFGGKLDLLLMRLTEMAMTIPAILLAIAFAALIDVQGRKIHLHPASLPWHQFDFTLRRGIFTIFLVIGFVSWPGMVRVIRGQTLSLKEREFVLAARALGASNRRIIIRYILPNLLSTIIVLAAMNTAYTILLESGLGYLGIGVPPPAPTWGTMIAEGQSFFAAAPHIAIAPGIALLITVLGFNLFGQGLQELLNPGKDR